MRETAIQLGKAYFYMLEGEEKVENLFKMVNYYSVSFG